MEMTTCIQWVKMFITGRQINFEFCTGKARSHSGKRKKMHATRIFSFLTMFSKSLVLRVVESQDCMVKG